MTEILIVCFILLGLLAASTLALAAIPVVPGELELWRVLRIQVIRRWITKRRRVNQPLHNVKTMGIARTNIRWHLLLTFLFLGLLARALWSGSEWWSALAGLLIVPSLAYFVGSLVQRQKIAIMHLRTMTTRDTHF
jgi:hypothetical protein